MNTTIYNEQRKSLWISYEDTRQVLEYRAERVSGSSQYVQVYNEGSHNFALFHIDSSRFVPDCGYPDFDAAEKYLEVKGISKDGTIAALIERLNLFRIFDGMGGKAPLVYFKEVGVENNGVIPVMLQTAGSWLIINKDTQGRYMFHSPIDGQFSSVPDKLKCLNLKQTEVLIGALGDNAFLFQDKESGKYGFYVRGDGNGIAGKLFPIYCDSIISEWPWLIASKNGRKEVYGYIRNNGFMKIAGEMTSYQLMDSRKYIILTDIDSNLWIFRSGHHEPILNLPENMFNGDVRIVEGAIFAHKKREGWALFKKANAGNYEYVEIGPIDMVNNDGTFRLKDDDNVYGIHDVDGLVEKRMSALREMMEKPEIKPADEITISYLCGTYSKEGFIIQDQTINKDISNKKSTLMNVLERTGVIYVLWLDLYKRKVFLTESRPPKNKYANIRFTIKKEWTLSYASTRRLVLGSLYSGFQAIKDNLTIRMDDPEDVIITPFIRNEQNDVVIAIRNGQKEMAEFIPKKSEYNYKLGNARKELIAGSAFPFDRWRRLSEEYDSAYNCYETLPKKISPNEDDLMQYLIKCNAFANDIQKERFTIFMKYFSRIKKMTMEEYMKNAVADLGRNLGGAVYTLYSLMIKEMMSRVNNLESKMWNMIVEESAK